MNVDKDILIKLNKLIAEHTGIQRVAKEKLKDIEKEIIKYADTHFIGKIFKHEQCHWYYKILSVNTIMYIDADACFGMQFKCCIMSFPDILYDGEYCIDDGRYETEYADNADFELIIGNDAITIYRLTDVTDDKKYEFVLKCFNELETRNGK